ncbi:MAG: Cdc6/Cdc18 family protein [Promethearchaeota archaeon]
MDIFSKLLDKAEEHSIFIDESKLEHDYLPHKLPYREKELSLLAQVFLPILVPRSGCSKNILITGNSGIGKTATLKLFGKILKNVAKKREISLTCVFLNCRCKSSSYKILIKIISSIRQNFPKRGYSSQDLLDIIKEFLELDNTYLLIILDELTHLIENDKDLLYSLTRLNDDSLFSRFNLSIIGIIRDISCLHSLDSGTLSTLQKNIIQFRNYSNEQIYDILKYRADLSFRKNVISEGLIRLVSDATNIEGDIRYGLNLLWKAGKIAEGKNLSKITKECIELAYQEVFHLKNTPLENVSKK